MEPFVRLRVDVVTKGLHIKVIHVHTCSIYAYCAGGFPKRKGAKIVAEVQPFFHKWRFCYSVKNVKFAKIFDLNNEGVLLPYFFDMLTEPIRQHILAFLSESFPDVFVIEMDMKEGRVKRFILTIDTDSGIDMGTCGDVNRALGRWMDEENIFEFDYAMEVSSPGVGEPLKLTRQYLKNVGRDLRVILQAGGEISGRLTAVEESQIIITPYLKKNYKKGQKPKLSDDRKPIAFEDIRDARVTV